MTYTLEFEGELGQWSPDRPMLTSAGVQLVLKRDGERIRKVVGEVNEFGMDAVREHFRNDDVGFGLARSQTALIRLVVDRLQRTADADALPDTYSTDSVVFRLDENDIRDVIASIETKSCTFQAPTESGTFCTVAEEQEGVRQVVLTDGRTAAPTTRRACRDCTTPDDGVRCSALTHVRVTDDGLGRDIIHRRLHRGECDLGYVQAQADPSGCRLGGHDCAHVVLSRSPGPAAVLADLVGLADAVDFLDAAWRNRYGARLLSPVRHSVIARLAQPADDADAFRTRLVDLTSVLDGITVEEARLESDARALFDAEAVDERGEPKRSLGRLEAFLKADLAPDLFTDGQRAIRTLRKVNRLRAQGGAHTNADAGKAYEAIGVERFAPWDQQWRQLASIVVGALTALRRAVEAAEVEADA